MYFALWLLPFCFAATFERLDSFNCNNESSQTTIDHLYSVNLDGMEARVEIVGNELVVSSQGLKWLGYDQGFWMEIDRDVVLPTELDLIVVPKDLNDWDGSKNEMAHKWKNDNIPFAMVRLHQGNQLRVRMVNYDLDVAFRKKLCQATVCIVILLSIVCKTLL